MIYTFALDVSQVVRVSVEADILRGLPYFSIVGLGDTAIKEARERIRSALLKNNLPFPRVRKIINLSPASFPKHGSHFDLPIAIALLSATGLFGDERIFTQTAFVGELGLDGTIRPSGSIIPFIFAAQHCGIKQIIVPFENAHEAVVAPEVTVHPVKDLKTLVEILKSKKLPQQAVCNKKEKYTVHNSLWAAVKGHSIEKRALTIAVAGEHNTLLRGAPGVGKTLLAKATQEILPPLTPTQEQEIFYRKSLEGMLRKEEVQFCKRPFICIDPLKKISNHPFGTFTQAHQGILFLEEIGLYSKNLLTLARDFLEEKKVIIRSQKETVELKTHCVIIGAFNPCVCGTHNKKCLCTEGQKNAYYRKISMPFFDRFDLFVDVPRIAHTVSLEEGKEDLKTIQAKVTHAQESAFQRGQKNLNGASHFQEIKSHCALSLEDQQWLTEGAEKLGLSTRALYKVIKVSRTIADLEEMQKIKRKHLAEALQYRFRP